MGKLGDNQTAVIEMARASGLALLSENEKSALNTTTYGTGQLFKAALDSGAKKFILGIGGMLQMMVVQVLYLLLGQNY